MAIAIPKAAASLVLLRGDKNNPEVLLGRRKDTLRFMPGYHVYPGGRIDESDYKESQKLDISKVQEIKGIHSTLPAIDTAAHVFGAIREVWEETGLLLGGSHSYPLPHGYSLPGQTRLIDAFNQKALIPLIHDCKCIAQAITPADSPVRFNTYFFIADASGVVEDSPPSGELENIGWYESTKILEKLQIADVTEAVLREALTFWKLAKNKQISPNPVPLLTYPIYDLEIQR